MLRLALIDKGYYASGIEIGDSWYKPSGILEVIVRGLARQELSSSGSRAGQHEARTL